MAVTFEVGAKVKVDVNELPYAGTIITYNEDNDPITYQVDVQGLGQVLTFEESEISSL